MNLNKKYIFSSIDDRSWEPYYSRDYSRTYYYRSILPGEGCRETFTRDINELDWRLTNITIGLKVFNITGRKLN